MKRHHLSSDWSLYSTEDSMPARAMPAMSPAYMMAC